MVLDNIVLCASILAIVMCALCGDVRHVVFQYVFQHGFDNI